MYKTNANKKDFSSVFPNFFYKSERTKREILINPQR